MILIAHRGLTNEYIKENTIKAFDNALKNGYKGFELDIRKTKDKKIVVLHDYLINRTSNGSGSVKKYTYKELKKINFGTKQIKSKIPLLVNIIKKFNNTIIFIELKEEFNYEEINAILKQNKTNTYYISSFKKKYLIPFLNKKYRVGLIDCIINKKKVYNYNFIMILEDLYNPKTYKYKNVEPVVYGVLNNINIKNKEILNNIKYII